MLRKLCCLLFAAASLGAAGDPNVLDQPLWYQRTASGELHAAWFEPGAQRLELRVLERGALRVSEVRFDDAGFVELQPAARPRRWTLDGPVWRASDGTQLIPAWVIPAGRGPGH